MQPFPAQTTALQSENPFQMPRPITRPRPPPPKRTTTLLPMTPSPPSSTSDNLNPFTAFHPYARASAQQPPLVLRKLAAPTSILLLLDETCNASAAISSALAHQSPSTASSTTLTILTIANEGTDQSTLLAETTCLLRSFRGTLHPQTQFRIYVVPRESPDLESTISKMLMRCDPDHVVFALTVCDSVTVTNYGFKQREKGRCVLITYMKVEEENVCLSDEESGWTIKAGQRCSSPVGWD
ncbi:hypothetical protein BCR33DRAFT_716897 [Rhizoclosmatium globosum]|uniref:Uncharacterized protein n=1 Tax=Rhizoclosmatium globosum TaxID=329046 RepID=A0A1Y2CBC4_9FUNG|nr:hypothetical protein BCR33DRAFT_716897 [Rhizoclosmatium globosum]|eukprot:ORY44340.1 hypothetical protein BCR33DRAFT_716897 [Rhizoclosmatium globosum]